MNLDELTLQSLADGELSHEEQKRLLRSLPADGSPWRRLALALLEEREVRRAIRSEARRDSTAVAANPGSQGHVGRWRFLNWSWLTAACVAFLALGYAWGRAVEAGHANVANASGETPLVPAPEPSDPASVPAQATALATESEGGLDDASDGNELENGGVPKRYPTFADYQLRMLQQGVVVRDRQAPLQLPDDPDAEPLNATYFEYAYIGPAAYQ